MACFCKSHRERRQGTFMKLGGRHQLSPGIWTRGGNLSDQSPATCTHRVFDRNASIPPVTCRFWRI